MSAPLVLLLALHITGLVVWCGALLYLPTLVASGSLRELDATSVNAFALNRTVFTRIATPAALFSIVTGSALFLLDRQLGLWLMMKLTAVTGMVVCHALVGVLILRQERDPSRRHGLPAAMLTGFSALLMSVVLWLVLAKPPYDF